MIGTVTLNPAIDVILEVSDLKINHYNKVLNVILKSNFLCVFRLFFRIPAFARMTTSGTLCQDDV